MTENAAGRHTAGLLDIRNVIGLLLVIYGVVLSATGLFADPEYDKTGGVNANLVAGAVLLVGGAAMMAWARLRPVVVDEHGDGSSEEPSDRPAGH